MIRRLLNFFRFFQLNTFKASNIILKKGHSDELNLKLKQKD